MTTVLFALMMQYVVAAKAGLVNHVQGITNVAAAQMVKPNDPIRTGPDGYVELLLTPGAFLRVGNGSEVVLDNVNLASVAVRVRIGTAVVEVVEPTGAYPLKIAAGDLNVDVADPGIYEFNADGHVTVIEGKLRAGTQGVMYKKGWQLSYAGNYRAQKILNPELTALDVYSKKRSELIARASTSLVPGVDRTGVAADSPYWLFSQILGAWTLIPYRNIRSPYGFNYAGVGDYRQAGYAAANPSAGPTTNSNFPANPPAATNNPSPGTFSTPAGDRQTGGSYSSGKAPSAGAQQPPPNN